MSDVFVDLLLVIGVTEFPGRIPYPCSTVAPRTAPIPTTGVSPTRFPMSTFIALLLLGAALIMRVLSASPASDGPGRDQARL